MPADILCLSHLRWGFVYQRPNHLMSRFARDRRVFFVEEPIFDAELPSLDIQHVENGLHIATPHLPPGLAPDVVEGMQRAMLDALGTRMNIHAPLLWFYTPMALGWAADIEASGIVYDCMDELSHFRGAPPELLERERDLFKLADVVFTGGQSLYEAKRAYHPNVHAFPSSVDFAHFERARRPTQDPPDQTGIPHPRLGFFGVIDERMDLDLIEALARSRPQYHVVMLGPVVKIDPARLPRLPNLHWLGGKDYQSLPDYVGNWDVALMPFARNDATKFISPTKTLEYMAAGLPIVSTSIHDVVRPYGEQGLVRIADDPHDFTAAVDAAVGERGTGKQGERARTRDAFLARTSWDSTWGRMDSLVAKIEGARGRTPAVKRQTWKEEAPCSTT